MESMMQRVVRIIAVVVAAVGLLYMTGDWSQTAWPPPTDFSVLRYVLSVEDWRLVAIAFLAILFSTVFLYWLTELVLTALLVRRR